MTESAFFQDLAVLMAVAGFVSVLFGKLGWPKVIGYLFAGILMSRHTWGGSLLADEGSVQTIGQLGIVLLMLTLGLEFSAGSLKKVRSVSGPMAVVDTVVMIWLGYTVGRRIFGWTSVQSLFLGAAICDSATTLLAKTIDEMKWSKRLFVRYVISTSIIEDVICVGVIALVTGVANGSGFSVGAVGLSLGSLAVFFVCTVVLGMIFVPRILNAVAKTGSDEALLLTLLGCCFFVSWVAYRLEFSLALGAFLMGVLGSSSMARERLLKLADPLRSMFAAMFFVSIGLLVNPAVCLSNAGTILLLSVVVMLGKGMNCFAVSMLTGQRVKTSVQTAFGLAQIGEFAYMVALLYIGATGDTESTMYQIVVGVSLITTCLNPFMLRISDPVGDFAERSVPERVKRWIAQYNVWLDRIRAASVPGETTSRVHRHLAYLAVCWVLMFAFSVVASMLNGCDWSRFSEFFDAHKKAFFCLAANIAFLAMLKPVWTAGRHLGEDVGELLLAGSRGGGKKWRRAVRRMARSSTLLAVSFVTVAEIVMLDVNLLPGETSVRIGIAVILAVAIPIAVRYLWPAVTSAGAQFNEALEAESRMAAQPKSLVFSLPEDRFLKVVLPETSPAVGLTIKDLNIRAKTGASIVSLTREGRRFGNPGADWCFKTGDTVEAIGDPRELASLKDMLGIVSSVSASGE
jgi:CPA2 family monovalent cation:H+ antiporter-2